MRVRRVGSFTSGILLIVFGGLFLLRFFVPVITYTFILHLWPLILIFLGVEVLLSNWRSDNVVIKYDAAAIVLVFVLIFFSVGMGITEFCLEWNQRFLNA